MTNFVEGSISINLKFEDIPYFVREFLLDRLEIQGEKFHSFNSRARGGTSRFSVSGETNGWGTVKTFTLVD